MAKGIQLGLLAVIAVILGVIAYSMTTGGNEGPVSKKIVGDDSAVRNANTITKSESGKTVKDPKTFDPLADQKKKEEPKQDLPKTTVKFVDYEHNFGVIDEGDRVEHTFSFTNTGTNPLVLETCKGSCGCTVPTCPKEPIPPGGTGEIEVVFNSKGKKHQQTKRITITGNMYEQVVLQIHAQVTPVEDQPQG